MIESFNERQLRGEILRRSVARNWDQARLEWNLLQVYEADEPSQCLCGHWPIIEICVLRNRKNANLAEVGNVCVQKFMGINSKKVFDALKRVRADIERALNPDTIELFRDRGVLSAWEEVFYMKTWRRTKLSSAQMSKRIEINKKVLVAATRAASN